MNKFAWMLMIVGLSVFTIGCGGEKKSDSTDGTTDSPPTDTPATDEPASDSPVKVKGGDPVDPSTILGTDNPSTDDATSKTNDVAPTADENKKTVTPPPIVDDIKEPEIKIDNPFKLPDDPTKKDG